MAVSLEWFKDCWSIKTFRGFRWLAFLLWAGLGFVFQEKRGTGLKGLGVLLRFLRAVAFLPFKGFRFFCAICRGLGVFECLGNFLRTEEGAYGPKIGQGG